MGERYYDPEIARWAQRDPVDQATSPTEGNGYMYAGADPINGSDPSGRNTFTDVLGIGSASSELRVHVLRRGGHSQLRGMRSGKDKLQPRARFREWVVPASVFSTMALICAVLAIAGSGGVVVGLTVIWSLFALACWVCAVRARRAEERFPK